MASWVRRQFTSAGITQAPCGPHLQALQGRFAGTVMLMIDVSGSMNGTPIIEAARGARQFVADAVQAHYAVGVMLWNSAVVAISEPSDDPSPALAILSPLTSASGGNHLIGPLNTCHQILEPFVGDRVVALFGDGGSDPDRTGADEGRADEGGEHQVRYSGTWRERRTGLRWHF